MVETFTADQTVGEVSRRSTAALEAMKRLGINHCCGAALTLAQAASAAGVPLDAVLKAVNAGGGTTLDVRGLEPPQPMVRVLERIGTLGPDEELTVMLDRRPVFLYPQLEDRGFAHHTEDVAPGHVRVVISRAKARTA